MGEKSINIQTAKLAKEKYFNEPCKYVHDNWGNIEDWEEDFGEFHQNSNQNSSVYYSAPTQIQLQDWLLEKHGYFVTVELAYNEWGRYSANVEKQAKDGKTAIIALDGFTIFDNPKDALEEGLYETLKLIE